MDFEVLFSSVYQVANQYETAIVVPLICSMAFVVFFH